MKKLLLTMLALVLAIALSITMVIPAVASPDPGLVGLWHLDGDADDSSGNGNNGTVYGATYVSGKFDLALSFNGSGNYVDCGGAVDDTISTGITLEAWIKPDLKQKGGIISSDIGASNKGYDFFLWYDSSPPTYRDLGYGTLFIDIGNGSGYGRTYWPIPSADWYGNWHHVVATWDGSDIILYADSSQVATVAFTGSYSDPGKNTLIGGINYSTIPYCPFKGIIDEVRIWDEALTADQIALSANSSVTWLPPVTNVDFVLQDGTTLPLKFQIYENGTLVTTVQPVFLEVTDGTTVHKYELGDGLEYLRWNADECCYIANLKTKDDGWGAGSYTATVGGLVTGSISFELSPDKGVGRGNSGK